jgi:hypothetical protein
MHVLSDADESHVKGGITIIGDSESGNAKEIVSIANTMHTGGMSSLNMVVW